MSFDLTVFTYFSGSVSSNIMKAQLYYIFIILICCSSCDSRKDITVKSKNIQKTKSTYQVVDSNQFDENSTLNEKAFLPDRGKNYKLMQRIINGL